MSCEEATQVSSRPGGDGRGGLRSGVRWWVECGECGIEWAEEGLPHYESPERARTAMFDTSEDSPHRDGFTTRTDGRVLCRHCSEAADCAEHGHEYLRWRPAYNDPEIEYRYCEHCGSSFQERLTALGGSGQL